MKILNLNGIGALPVGFKGKIYGYPFKILVQFDAFGGVKAQIYEDDNKGSLIAEVTGRKGEVETEGSGFATWAYLRYKKDNKESYVFTTDTDAAKKQRDTLLKDARKKADALIKNLHKEVIDFNKGKDTRVKKAKSIVLAPVPKLKTVTAPKPVAKKKVTSSEKKNIALDKKRSALPPGKRPAGPDAKRKFYFESRRNRSDKPGTKL